MKSLFILAFAAAVITGCRNSNPTSSGDSTINATYTLTDTAGHASSEFVSGEPFKLFFSVTNTTKDTLKYNLAPPEVAFTIYQNKNFISSSFYGCPEPQFIAIGVPLAPGKSIQSSWVGPGSPCQSPKIKLAPGDYQVQVLFPKLSNVKINNTEPISFTVIP